MGRTLLSAALEAFWSQDARSGPQKSLWPRLVYHCWRTISLTASIRRSIISDGSLSTYAHNVKIVVQNGVATLKGPVRTQEEKAAIDAKAAAVVGQDHVVDQMEIAPQ